MRNDRVNISLDERTKNLLDEYGREHSLSRSAVIRLLTNDFFLKQEAKA